MEEWGRDEYLGSLLWIGYVLSRSFIYYSLKRKEKKNKYK
jgi:hypothetical protein